MGRGTSYEGADLIDADFPEIAFRPMLVSRLMVTRLAIGTIFSRQPRPRTNRAHPFTVVEDPTIRTFQGGTAE